MKIQKKRGEVKRLSKNHVEEKAEQGCGGEIQIKDMDKFLTNAKIQIRTKSLYGHYLHRNIQQQQQPIFSNGDDDDGRKKGKK